jgi:hypothetical protein
MAEYKRVIPRDLFNEAKLLKCFGLLSLKIHDRMLPEGIEVKIWDVDAPFQIKLLDEGSLWICNYPTELNGEDVIFKTTYNSKANYPLICEYRGGEYRVFNEQGEFDEEFINIALEARRAK